MAEKYSQVSASDAESTSTLLRPSSDDEAGSARWRHVSSMGTKRSRAALSVSSVLLRAIAILLALLCVGSFVYMSRTLQTISTELAVGNTESGIVDYGDCGAKDDVEGARAKGCVFDPMGWIWTRPECYDAELVADFMNRTDWSWHTSPKLDEASRVPMSEIYAGDHPKLFVAKKYHYVHCTYMWRKMHKALVNHKPIDSYLTDFTHTHHCEMVLLNDFLHEDVQCTEEMVCPTWVRATWTSCSTL